MSLTANPNVTSETLPTFQLKGGLYTLTSLQLLTASLELLGKDLDHKLQQAPKFFLNAPIVVDLQKVNQTNTFIDFNQLKIILLKRHLIPVGVRNGNTEQHSEASKSGFAILQDHAKDIKSSKEKMREAVDTFETAEYRKNPQGAISENSEDAILENLEGTILKNSESKAHNPETFGSNTKIITEPVRSGQQIYVRGGDLIVLAPVSHGAELLADGNIHVYGPLRGRALAGITGDVTARIFCQCLEAELISVAGQYIISEDMANADWRSAVTIFLENGRLQVKPL